MKTKQQIIASPKRNTSIIKIFVIGLICISELAISQTVTTIAGSTRGSCDGVGAAGHFSDPFGITTDGKGNLYVADASNGEIRKIVIATGLVSTLAGTTAYGSADGTGS